MADEPAIEGRSEPHARQRIGENLGDQRVDFIEAPGRGGDVV